jgi:D-ribose pyranase
LFFREAMRRTVWLYHFMINLKKVKGSELLMKKTTLINAEISHLIAKLGHGDSIVIADSGLPIPDQVKRIDLALKKGVPGFMDVLDTVLTEQRVEEVIIAREAEEISPLLYQEILAKLAEVEQADTIKIKIVKVSHEELKRATKDAKAVIRSGEFTAYANIILKSGVVF